MAAAKITVHQDFRHDLYEETLMVERTSFKDYKEKQTACEAVMKKWEEAAKHAGPGTKVNKIVRFQVADGYAIYIVGRVGERTCILIHIPFYDAYRSPAVQVNGSCPRKTVDAMIGSAESMRALFRKSDDDNARFFDSLAVGQIVHVTLSSFGWVRCKVVDADYEWGHVKGHGKCLLAVAPVGTLKVKVDNKWVGDWFSHDLYTVSRTGEVHYSYTVDRIKEGKPFRCHASAVFEYDPQRNKWHSDPTTASVLDMDPPDPDLAALKTRQQWRDVEAVAAILDTNDAAPDVLLNQVHAKLHQIIERDKA